MKTVLFCLLTLGRFYTTLLAKSEIVHFYCTIVVSRMLLLIHRVEGTTKFLCANRNRDSGGNNALSLLYLSKVSTQKYNNMSIERSYRPTNNTNVHRNLIGALY